MSGFELVLPIFSIILFTTIFTDLLFKEFKKSDKYQDSLSKSKFKSGLIWTIIYITTAALMFGFYLWLYKLP